MKDIPTKHIVQYYCIIFSYGLSDLTEVIQFTNVAIAIDRFVNRLKKSITVDSGVRVLRRSGGTRPEGGGYWIRDRRPVLPREVAGAAASEAHPQLRPRATTVNTRETNTTLGDIMYTFTDYSRAYIKFLHMK